MSMTKSEEQMRSEIQRIPINCLANIGSVSEPREVPPCTPFEASEPFPLDAQAFTDEKEKRLDSIAKAVIKVDWKQILEKK